MKTIAFSTLAAVTMALSLVASAGAARADGGGEGRMAAGGAHMSTYVHHPYHDPRSAHSQMRGTGHPRRADGGRPGRDAPRPAGFRMAHLGGAAGRR